jgi:hypothetical protein
MFNECWYDPEQKMAQLTTEIQRKELARNWKQKSMKQQDKKFFTNETEVMLSGI